MKYESFFTEQISALQNEGRYREFINLEKNTSKYPLALRHKDGKAFDITIWCSNDYLALGQDEYVINAATKAIQNQGAGAGGTRNIAGSNIYHVKLEQELASLHNKEAALTFNSGYTSNLAGLSTLGRMIEDLVFFSDADNHNSLIEGIRSTKNKKVIFKHNDMEDLQQKLSSIPKETPKIIVFESVYSMDGSVAPMKQLVELAEEFNAMTWADEVHAVGLYGENGGGKSQEFGLADKITFIEGTLAKAIGNIGGYVTGSKNAIDFIRSNGYSFIFSTALPPAIAAGAIAAIEKIKNGQKLRELHQRNSKEVMKRLQDNGILVLPTQSHIVPVFIGNAKLCKKVSDYLLNQHNIYVQPINYPTVARGTERLRITPSPKHDDEHIEHLINAMIDTKNHFINDWPLELPKTW